MFCNLPQDDNVLTVQVSQVSFGSSLFTRYFLTFFSGHKQIMSPSSFLFNHERRTVETSAVSKNSTMTYRPRLFSMALKRMFMYLHKLIDKESNHYNKNDVTNYLLIVCGKMSTFKVDNYSVIFNMITYNNIVFNKYMMYLLQLQKFTLISHAVILLHKRCFHLLEVS